MPLDAPVTAAVPRRRGGGLLACAIAASTRYVVVRLGLAPGQPSVRRAGSEPARSSGQRALKISCQSGIRAGALHSTGTASAAPVPEGAALGASARGLPSRGPGGRHGRDHLSRNLLPSWRRARVPGEPRRDGGRRPLPHRAGARGADSAGARVPPGARQGGLRAGGSSLSTALKGGPTT